MGGKAISGVRRITSSEHTQLLYHKLLPPLRRRFIRAESPRYLPTKQTHGDIDLVVLLDGTNNDMNSLCSEIARDWNAVEFVRSGSVTNTTAMASFKVFGGSNDNDGVQVDVNFVSPTTSITKQHEESCCCPSLNTTDHSIQIFEAYCGFMDYGDFSRIIGIVAGIKGVKYSHRGLSVVPPTFFSNKKTPPSLVLTHSVPDALAFLLTNCEDEDELQRVREKWREGFSGEDDMFEFLAGRKAIMDARRVLQRFVFDDEGSVDGGDGGIVRRKKPNTRPGFERFVAFLCGSVAGGIGSGRGGNIPNKDGSTENAIPKETTSSFAKIKKNCDDSDSYLAMSAIRHFQKLDAYETAIRVFQRRVELDDTVKQVFSGDVIMRVIGVAAGREVGEVKRRVVEALVGDDGDGRWKENVASMDGGEVEELIRRCWKDFKDSERVVD
ncbi:hypothetical protein HK100_006841 [Physocladia obscura]|uniref:Uncharacterized protein n=1 Tax=Physocladia obscura TaxID=109957 RepID=A0AAD5SPV4_9FUNG|nr:hypothetical protein HK100_006841 [Physocladia obscura]